MKVEYRVTKDGVERTLRIKRPFQRGDMARIMRIEARGSAPYCDNATIYEHTPRKLVA